MVTVIVIAGTLYAPDAPVGRLLTRLVYWAICSVCQVRAVGSSISADLTWIPVHMLRTPAGYNEAWAFGSICPLCHLLGPNRSEPLSISADLAWIPALLHAYSVTHYVPAGYNEASGSFCPLGHPLGLPGTRPPSISADPDFVSCTHTRCPITRPSDTTRLLARFIHWAICSGRRVQDRRPSVLT